MLVKTSDLKEISELLLELSKSKKKYINLKTSFKLNLIEGIEVPNMFSFKAETEEQGELLVEYLSKIHGQAIQSSDWKIYPTRYYLFVENGEYKGGNREFKKNYPLISFADFKDYVEARIAGISISYSSIT